MFWCDVKVAVGAGTGEYLMERWGAGRERGLQDRLFDRTATRECDVAFTAVTDCRSRVATSALRQLRRQHDHSTGEENNAPIPADIGSTTNDVDFDHHPLRINTWSAHLTTVCT